MWARSLTEGEDREQSLSVNVNTKVTRKRTEIAHPVKQSSWVEVEFRE
jgi:hypothetical protein